MQPKDGITWHMASRRERAGKSYHVLPYYLARFIVDVPLLVGQGILFGTSTIGLPAALACWIV
jgi:hypothetical protein